MNQIPLVGETKSKILHELGGNRRKTASQIAADLKIQVSAVRKHLESLHAEGIVFEEFVRDGIGRPKKFYSLTENGREMFPRQYELVLTSLIERLVTNEDRSYVESNLKRVAADIVQTKLVNFDRPASDEQCLEDRVSLLSASMNKFGFETTVEEAGNGGIRIVSHNCPLYKAAKKFPDLMCQALHGEIIRNALQADVRLERCLLSGDAVCVHSVREKNDAKKTL